MAKIHKEGIDRWYDYDIDVDNRTIWIGSPNKTDEDESGVDYRLSERVIKGLHILEKNAPDGTKPIFLIINNFGGDEVEGLAIIDRITECKNHVTITGYGKVFSMAGYIMQACDHRVMSKNAAFLLHEGTRGLPSDHPRIVAAWNKYYDKLDAIFFDTYFTKIREKNPDFSKKKLEEMLKFDTILNAAETVGLGLADEILGE